VNYEKLLKSTRRGSAIPQVVVAIIILFAMGVELLSLGFNGRIYSMRIASDIKARCAADGGLEMALFEMNQKLQIKPFNEGTLPQAIDVKLPYSDKVCSYRVTGNPGSGYVITSLGQSGQAKRDVRATIGLQSPFNNAILTKESLTLKSGTVVDGDIVCDNGSSINTEAPSEKAATLQLFAAGTDTQFFDVKAKSNWIINIRWFCVETGT